MVKYSTRDAVRPCKLNNSFKSIVKDISNATHKRSYKTAKPYNTVVTKKDFHERQHAAHCGLHAIHNLLRSKNIKKEDLDNAAVACAKESGDSIQHHKHRSGFWSINSIIRTLEKNGFHVKRAVKTKREYNKTVYMWDAGKTMYQMLEDIKIMGFIIHEPYHYTCYRKTLDGQNWQYSNSYYPSAQNMNPHEFCKQALEGVWNIFLVTKI